MTRVRKYLSHPVVWILGVSAIALAICGLLWLVTAPGRDQANAQTTPPTPTTAAAAPTTAPAPTQAPAQVAQPVFFKAAVFRNGKGVVGAESEPFTMMYDPSQSGHVGLFPKGWWWFPSMPLNGEYNEGTFIIHPGIYWYVGPLCTVYFDYDRDANLGGIGHEARMKYPHIDHNDLNYTIGGEGEVYAFWECREYRDGTGMFSFALR